MLEALDLNSKLSKADYKSRMPALQTRLHQLQRACWEANLATAKGDAIVMHPGPINRGVELDSGTADGPRSVILQQVTHGIAIRMAVISMVMASHAGETAE